MPASRYAGKKIIKNSILSTVFFNDAKLPLIINYDPSSAQTNISETAKGAEQGTKGIIKCGNFLFLINSNYYLLETNNSSK